MKLKAIVCLFFLSINAVFAQNVYVNQASTASNPDGSSWANAYPNLHQAIANSPSNTNIWIAKGTYSPTLDTLGNVPSDLRDKTFYLKKTIHFYGGFAGNETMLSQANASLNPTILTGEIQNNGNDADNAYHIFTVIVNNQSLTNVFKDLIFEKGMAKPDVATPARNFGGAFYFDLVNGADKLVAPMFENCIFRDNTALTGGTLYFKDGAPEIAPVFKKCVFKNSLATGTTGTFANPLGSGGVVYFNHTTNKNSTKFENCVFEGNRANSAGCIYNISFQNSSSAIQVLGCSFYNNFANGSGGVMYSCSNGPTVTNMPLFINCQFVENQANAQGGVLYNLANQGETSPTVVNCTFYKNAVNNAAINGAGASLYNNASAAGTAVCRPKIYNSILWNKPTMVAQDIYNNVANANAGTYKRLTTLVSHCIYSDGVVNGALAATDSVVFLNSMEADPLFVNINNVAGPDAKWGTTDDGLALQSTSPGINAGNAIYSSFRKNTNSKIAASAFDITGTNARNVNGTIDLGSFEYQVVNGPLAVNLLKFEAKKENQKTIISWQTSQENQIDKYQLFKKGIEPSAEWKVVNEQLAQNKSSKNVYQYIDLQQNKAAYYQLKWYDLSTGKWSQSAQIFVDKNESTSLIFGANTVSDVLKIGSGNDLQHLEIYTITGRKVNAPIFNNQLIVSQLPNGIYVLKAKSSTEKFIVLH